MLLTPPQGRCYNYEPITLSADIFSVIGAISTSAYSPISIAQYTNPASYSPSQSVPIVAYAVVPNEPYAPIITGLSNVGAPVAVYSSAACPLVFVGDDHQDRFATSEVSGG